MGDVTKNELTKVQEGVQALQKDLAEFPELADALRPTMTRLTSLVDMYDLRLKQAGEVARNGRQLVLQKSIQEYESIRMDIVAKLRACVEAQSKSMDGFFDELSKSGGGSVHSSDVITFLTENNCEITLENFEFMFTSQFG